MFIIELSVGFTLGVLLGVILAIRLGLRIWAVFAGTAVAAIVLAATPASLSVKTAITVGAAAGLLLGISREPGADHREDMSPQIVSPDGDGTNASARTDPAV